MGIITLGNLGKAGLNLDTPACEIPPEHFTHVENIRFDADLGVSKFPHENQIFSNLSFDPYHLVFTKDNNDTPFWIALGLANAHVWDGSTWNNITPAVPFTGAQTDIWTGGVLNGVPIVTNGIDKPHMWFPLQTTQVMAELANWPANAICRAIRPFKWYAVAMNITEDGNEYPNRVWWSSPADPGSVPPSWDYTDPTQDAGWNELPQEGGHVVDGVDIGNVFLLFKENAIHRMSPYSQPYVMRFEQVSTQAGIMSPRARVRCPKGVLFASNNDLLITNGQQIESVLKQRIRRELYSMIPDDLRYKTFLMPNRLRQEVWMCIATGDGTHCDRALVWNWETGATSMRSLPDCTHIAEGVVYEASGPSQAYDDQTGNYDDDLRRYNERTTDSDSLSDLMAVPGTPAHVRHVGQSTTTNGAPYSARAERTGLALTGQTRQGTPIVDQNTLKVCRGVWPKVSCTPGKSVDVYVGQQRSLEEATIWSGPFPFDPQTMDKIDCTVVGRYLGIRIESVNQDMYWHCPSYQMDIDVVSRF